MVNHIKTELEYVIISIFDDLLGKDVSESLVGSAAQLDDPDQHPVDFLNNCKGVFSRLLGEETAKEKLKKVYSKLSKGR